jgi:ubiquinone/menaquinone biosynthesis C-methylase UbiE
MREVTQMKKYLNNRFDLDNNIDLLDELPFWSAAFGLKLLNGINYKPNITALDIGFGTGFPLTELAMRLGDEAIVYGVDPWKAAIERLRNKIGFYGITNIRIIEGVAEHLPLADASVDLITSNNGINNVSDMAQVFSECARILRPGGQFIFTLNTAGSFRAFYDTLEKVLSEFGLQDEIEKMNLHIARKRPDVGRVCDLMLAQGFSIHKVDHHEFSYKFATGTALLSHYFIRLAFMDPWIKLLPPERVEEIFDRIEVLLNEQSQRNGAIDLCVPFVVVDSGRQLAVSS